MPHLYNMGGLHPSKAEAGQPAPNLVLKLCQALGEEEIVYCHWKSNNALARSASGDNDLDFLVHRADMLRFIEILCRLGFKQAKAPAEKRSLGVLDYFGYDEEADKFVHVHAHDQLIVGHDMSKNYRLPIEKPYLESVIQGDPFKIPAPEFEFIVFVIRMVLKHLTWDAILSREGRLKSTEQEEFNFLQARITPECIDPILQRHLPYISVELFNDCLQAFHADTTFWKRIKTGQRLQARLQMNALRPWISDLLIKYWRRAALAISWRFFGHRTRYQLQSGGALIAIIGGDGAGKSTAVNGLYAWLSKDLKTTTVHMGKPAWSLITKIIRGTLKIGSLLGLYPPASTYNEMLNQKSRISPVYPWLIRQICTARDRSMTYLKARRFAANGGIVVLDRFPHPQIQLMDGPQGKRFISPHKANKFVLSLIKLEESYYQQITIPDLTIVLRVNPELAVQRKVDEKSSYVRERSTEIWEMDWEPTDANIIDADKSKSEVLAELKTLVWSQL